MAVLIAVMLLMQFGIFSVIYGIGTLGGKEPRPDGEIAQLNAWVCAPAALLAAGLAFSSFVEQGARPKRRASGGTQLAAFAYITIAAIIAGWGVWTTLWYLQTPGSPGY